MKIFVITILAFLITVPTAAQEILLSESGYVLIDTTFSSNDMGSKFYIVRATPTGETTIAVIELLETRSQGTIARVTHALTGLTVQKGDALGPRVSGARSPRITETAPCTEQGVTIIKRQGDLILFLVDARGNEVGEIVDIVRYGTQGVFTIGSAEVLEQRDDKVAAQIIKRKSPYEVAVGDYIIRAAEEQKADSTELDIDYYFLGRFKSAKK